MVEWVTNESEGSKAGIQAGDVLLEWSRGKTTGSIISPFDLPYIRFEQAARSPVKVIGLRRNRRMSWRLGPEIWGIAARPNLGEQLLAIYREGEAFARAGNLQKAVERWRTAAAIAQDSSASWLSPWLLSHAAQALYGAQQSGQSNALYQEALQQAHDAGPVVNAELYRQLASGYKYLNDAVNTEKYYGAALAQWRKLGPGSISASQTLLQIGLVRHDSGKTAEAEEADRQALLIAETSAPDSIPVAWSLSQLGTIAADRGNLKKAEAYFRRALALETRFFPFAKGTALTLADLGVVAHQRGNLRAAERYYMQALAAAERRAPESLEVASILSDLGECVLGRGNTTAAARYQKHALSIRKRLAPGQITVALTLFNLGEIALARGRAGQAEDYDRQAMAIAGKSDVPSYDKARILAGLANVLAARGDLAQAEGYYRQAMAMTNQVAPGGLNYLEIMADLAGVLRLQQKFDQAARLYHEALSGYEAELVQLGGIEDDRTHYRAKSTRYYKEYADVLTQQGHAAHAFEVLEGSRARTLLEVIARSGTTIRSSVPKTMLARRQSLRESLNANSEYRIRLLQKPHTQGQLARVDSEIADILRQLRDVKMEIRQISPRYAALIEPRALTTSQIQQLLGPNTCLLEYSLGEERSLLWTVSEDSLQVHELVRGAAIERVARKLYRALRLHGDTLPASENRKAAWGSATGDYERLAAQLSRLILAPVAGLLQGKRLVIVADGALQYIPFAALPNPQNPDVPLIVDHEIVTLPAASIIAELRRQREGRPEATGEVAVLADPVFDAADDRVITSGKAAKANRPEVARFQGDLVRSASDVGFKGRGGVHFARLLHSREESEAILEATPRGRVIRALDFQANRVTAMNPGLAHYRIIHFATHGLVDSKRPELSGLVLSLVTRHGQPQDGFLGLEDIYNLNLPVDLVVLSGCETALGKQMDGEGLIGLTRGFMYAGANGVVASLWNVNDQATSKLMARFYRAMEQEKMKPAAALRKAQIEMWKQKRWRSPYYWSAFQIQGDWK